ncbi:TauD/TfdA family dioxygenase [Salinispora cortesiana]|uniref:TauD/TfdA family dioxygenase n=1 Tax=Salinispora cortesiana TaxID=1305843 RepID=UPI0004A4105D|nr:TauD/TfdA family dioxygenase [Salinispora cortesiana]
MLFADPVRVVVPSTLACRLAQVCTLEMDGHRWSAPNVFAARQVLDAPLAQAVLDAIRRRLARAVPTAPGWAVVALPPQLGDEEMKRVAAGLLATLGRPFFSIDQNGALWIGGESSPERDRASFGGFGAQALHIDAPNVRQVPDYTSLLVLRPDPAGGGVSLIGDLQEALAHLTDAEQAMLRRAEVFEGRADGLLGVGAPLLPFPMVTAATDGGWPWIRWAGKLLDDPRNQRYLPILERFAQALSGETRAIMLGRGQLLIADQRRVAHGRTALGDPRSAATGLRRCILQAKVAFEATATAQLVTVEAGVSDA